MGIDTSLRDVAVRLLVERPAARHSVEEWSDTLDRSGAHLGMLLAALEDTAANRRQLRHIIGLERWGQRRLRVALGEPAIADEMDGYQPPEELSVSRLAAELAITRKETVELARRCAATPQADQALVPHNQLGPLSIRGWLRYLNLHANLEARRLR